VSEKLRSAPALYERIHQGREKMMKGRNGLLISMGVILLVACSVGLKSQPAEEAIRFDPSPNHWAMLDANPQRTRYITATIRPPLRVVWKTQQYTGLLGVDNDILPAAADEERVYFHQIAKKRLYLVAVDATTGKERWRCFLGCPDFRGGVVVKPVVAGGRVFVLLDVIPIPHDKTQWALLALNAETGKLEWETGTISSQAFAHPPSAANARALRRKLGAVSFQMYERPQAPYEVSTGDFSSDNLYLSKGILVFRRDRLRAHRASDGRLLWGPDTSGFDQGLALFGDYVVVGDGSNEGPLVQLRKLSTGERVREIQFQEKDYAVYSNDMASAFTLDWVNPSLELFYVTVGGGAGYLFGGKTYRINRMTSGPTLTADDCLYELRMGTWQKDGGYAEKPPILVASDALSGREIWHIRENIRPCAIAGDVLWGLDTSSRLVAIDCKQGGILWRSESRGYGEFIVGPQGIYAVMRQKTSKPNSKSVTAYSIYALVPSNNAATR
jgi:hypothetical protein